MVLLRVVLRVGARARLLGDRRESRRRVLRAGGHRVGATIAGASDRQDGAAGAGGRAGARTRGVSGGGGSAAALGVALAVHEPTGENGDAEEHERQHRLRSAFEIMIIAGSFHISCLSLSESE